MLNVMLSWIVVLLIVFSGAYGFAGEKRNAGIINAMAGFEDRSAGTPGNQQAADFIEKEFINLGFKTIGSQRFILPVRTKSTAVMTLAASKETVPLDPFVSNAVSPDTVLEPGIRGPVIYAGSGDFAAFNHKPVKGSVVLMELDSGKNWINAFSLGADALIYIERDHKTRFLYEDKTELTPVRFPRFVMDHKKAAELFGPLENIGGNGRYPEIEMVSDLSWKGGQTRNIYCLVPGVHETLKQQLIVVEGFYDTTAYIAGKSPGADQACSIAALIDLAVHLKKNPPDRSILLVATSGHSSTLYGMRELVWAFKEKTKTLKGLRDALKETINQSLEARQLLEASMAEGPADPKTFQTLKLMVSDDIRTQVDQLNRRLMLLRLSPSGPGRETEIESLISRRMALNQLSLRPAAKTMNDEEKALFRSLIPYALERHTRRIKDSTRQKQCLEDALALKKLTEDFSLELFLSLHLSSHGTGIGAFNQGWLYPLKETVDRYQPYAGLDDRLRKIGSDLENQLGFPGFFKDSLRPSLQMPWQGYFLDTPPLGGEVSTLAGFLGLTLVTVQDARLYWGTPQDTPDSCDFDYAGRQSRFVSQLISRLSSEKKLKGKRLPKDGFGVLDGRANFIRHGEVFADKPAPESIILAFQGPGMFHSLVDQTGQFLIKGVADKKHVLDKVILEGYRFDDKTGETIWAIDKKKTTKERYRIKMKRKEMRTDLTMFECRQKTITGLLEARNFNYMTKIELFDARFDAAPVRYWYSRIDTRKSTLCSLFLEPGSRIKLTLSDTLLTNKLILTNADPAHPLGTGYPVDGPVRMTPTRYLAARDMWALLNPRIETLEKNGVNNQKIRELTVQGNEALTQAGKYYKKGEIDQFFKASTASLALAGRVYDHVETTGKDVLFGVLFYIALFVPFAFCLERFVFAFINIYKRIIAFLLILIGLIAVIYQVHPAFRLAYSPLVVILAFFIIGLSFVVSWIIFYRFEDEVKKLRNSRSSAGEISLFKAFSASFFIGVSNLRRRKMRTLLTCTTLIILTFTLMGFTTVKNIRQHTKLSYDDDAPYSGLLMKPMNWQELPEEAFYHIGNALPESFVAAPRAWLETQDKTQSPKVPVSYKGQHGEAAGLLGITAQEKSVSRLDRFLVAGRWFEPEDRQCVILSRRMAQTIGLSETGPLDVQVTLWSVPFKVIGLFDGDILDQFSDLDGEPMSPVIFPDEVIQRTTEAEMDALESGDEIRSFQGRYTHIPFDSTLIIPFNTLMGMGGSLKSVAVSTDDTKIVSELINHLVDRFGLWLFSGESEGVSIYTASDTLSYSGVPNILIPVLISVCIVLSTMIGSVVERKREIGIYTSVGMAPTHVGVLFIAEAVSYAVLSVVIGYVLAQVFANVFEGTRLLSGITVNYSSLAGVGAMGIVMLVVVLSSLYPAYVASTIAIPDVEKAWTLSKPDGNRLTVDLPFLMKPGEVKTAADALHDYVVSHQEISHGAFCVEDIKIDQRIADSALSMAEPDISFTAWLAPFDLGVMQRVCLSFKPAPMQQGYYDIRMTLERQSGEYNTWWRINRRFVNQIRKQLLVWRSMDESRNGIDDRGTAETSADQGGNFA